MAKTKQKILLIEDDQMLIDMYKLKFSECGYEVLCAETGSKGYDLAIANNPNIILLDIILPQMDGFTIMEKLRKHPKTKTTPVIFLTNLRQDEDIQRGKKLGAVDYLVKASLTPAQVLEKVKKYIK